MVCRSMKSGMCPPVVIGPAPFAVAGWTHRMARVFDAMFETEPAAQDITARSSRPHSASGLSAENCEYLPGAWQALAFVETVSCCAVYAAQSSTGARDRANDAGGSNRSAVLRTVTAAGEAHWAAAPIRRERRVIIWVRGRRCSS